MRQYDFITIQQVPNSNPAIFAIINNKSGDELGTLSYYGRWKQWVLNARSEAVFAASCLLDICDFIHTELPGKGIKPTAT